MKSEILGKGLLSISFDIDFRRVDFERMVSWASYKRKPQQEDIELVTILLRIIRDLKFLEEEEKSE